MQHKARIISILKPEDLDKICPARERPVNTEVIQTPEAAVNVLNAMPVWGGRVRWAAFKRVGGLLIGITADGEECRFDVSKLIEFRHIQSRVLEYLGIAVTPPKRGQYAVVAGTIGELMIRAAAHNTIEAGNLEDDLKALLQRAWREASHATAQTDAQLFGALRTLRDYRRKPHAEALPACVIRFGAEVLVYPQVLQAWISCPVGAARHLTLTQIRESLGLLGLRPHEFDLECNGERLCMILWRGPAGVLDEV
jgi:hypothetical protein